MDAPPASKAPRTAQKAAAASSAAAKTSGEGASTPRAPREAVMAPAAGAKSASTPRTSRERAMAPRLSGLTRKAPLEMSSAREDQRPPAMAPTDRRIPGQTPMGWRPFKPHTRTNKARTKKAAFGRAPPPTLMERVMARAGLVPPPHPHIDETRRPIAPAYDPTGFDVGASERGPPAALSAAAAIVSAAPSAPAAISSDAAAAAAASPSAGAASPRDSAASPSAASVSSNDSVQTAARYKKHGYDKTTLRQLPIPPERHPSSGQINRFDPNEAVDPNKDYDIRRLLARRGKPPKLAYLVEWEGERCVLSWMWEKNLSSVKGLMDHVDKWKAERASGITKEASITKWYKKNRVASASPTSRCFFESLQAALFALKLHGKLSSSTWCEFELKHPRNMDNGVNKSDMAAFFTFLFAVKAPIHVPVLRLNRLTKTAHSVKSLEDYARELEPGWYVVHAGQHEVEHCFALGAFGPWVLPCVIDKYDDSANPPCHLEPIHNLTWIKRTLSVRRVEVFVPRKKAKTQ